MGASRHQGIKGLGIRHPAVCADYSRERRLIGPAYLRSSFLVAQHGVHRWLILYVQARCSSSLWIWRQPFVRLCSQMRRYCLCKMQWACMRGRRRLHRSCANRCWYSFCNLGNSRFPTIKTGMRIWPLIEYVMSRSKIPNNTPLLSIWRTSTVPNTRYGLYSLWFWLLLDAYNF